MAVFGSNTPESAEPAPTAPATRDDAASPFARRAAIVIACACGAAVLLALLLGNTFTLAAAAVVSLATLQGLWRGGAETVSVFVAMIVAVLLGPPLGRALEAPVASAIGAGGMMGRFAAIATGVIVVVVLSSVVLALVARRFLRRVRWWRTNDRLLGAGVGFLTGSFAATLLAWSLLAIAPVAEAQLAAARRDAEARGEAAPNSRVSEWVVGASDKVRTSALGSVAANANPLRGAEIFSLADDFVAISRDRRAMEAFKQSEAVQDLASLSSLETAMERLRAETDLVERIEVEGFTGEIALEAMRSPAVLRILDETRVLRDIKPRLPDLKRALQDARAIADDDDGPAPE